MIGQKKYFIAGIILMVGLFLLTPRLTVLSDDEESYKPWVGARLVKETGGFPVVSACPLYILYLEMFEGLKYPLSFKVEHFVTRFFLHAAIFLMLLRFLAWPLALLMTCAWIPYFALVDPGSALWGTGFLCLYLRGPGWKCNRGYFPIMLIAAFLEHPALAPFLAGHFVGEVIKRRRQKSPLINWKQELMKINPLTLMIRMLLILLIGLCVLFPFKRVENNRSFTNSLYFYVPGQDQMGDAFFMNGTWKEVVRRFPKSEWYKHDWYFDAPLFYKGAATIFQSVCRVPDLVGKNLLENIGDLWHLPCLFWTGNLQGKLSLFSLVLFPLGLIGMRRYYQDKDYYPESLSILVGSIMLIGSYCLGRLGVRYYIALLPVGLLCLCSFAWGWEALLKINVQPSRGIKDKAMFWWGIIFLAGTLIYNPLFYYSVFPRGMAHFPYDCWLKEMMVLLFSTGTSFIVYAFMFPQSLGRRPMGRLTSIVVCLSAGTVLWTSWYPYGKAHQVKAILKHRPFFDAPIIQSYGQLFKGLNQDTKIMSLDSDWLKAFGPVKFDNIYGVMDLPPFEDKTGKTRELLNSMDVIEISSALQQPQPDISTQSYLRYQLHLEGFLKGAVNKGWSKEEVPGYGTIYRRGA